MDDPDERFHSYARVIDIWLTVQKGDPVKRPNPAAWGLTQSQAEDVIWDCIDLKEHKETHEELPAAIKAFVAGFTASLLTERNSNP